MTLVAAPVGALVVKGVLKGGGGTVGDESGESVDVGMQSPKMRGGLKNVAIESQIRI